MNLSQYLEGKLGHDMASLSQFPAKSSSFGSIVTYKPSNSSFRAISFSRLNIISGTFNLDVLA